MKNGKFHKISIITPVLNAAEFLERTIQNVISQNYPELEYIIVDGGSTDGTLEIIKKYPSVKLIQEKGSQSKAFNIGFLAATGDILGAVNGDDTYCEGIFHFVNEYFLNQPDCEFLMGNLQFIENGKPGFLNVPRHTMPEMMYWWEKNAYCFNPVGYFYTCKVRDSVPPFKENNHYDMDHSFLLEAGSRFRIHKVEKTFGHFYFHEKNKTSQLSRENFFTHYLNVKRQSVEDNLYLLSEQDKLQFKLCETFFLCRLFVKEVIYGKFRFQMSEYLQSVPYFLKFFFSGLWIIFLHYFVLKKSQNRILSFSVSCISLFFGSVKKSPLFQEKIFRIYREDYSKVSGSFRLNASGTIDGSEKFSSWSVSEGKLRLTDEDGNLIYLFFLSFGSTESFVLAGSRPDEIKMYILSEYKAGLTH